MNSTDSIGVGGEVGKVVGPLVGEGMLTTFCSTARDVFEIILPSTSKRVSRGGHRSGISLLMFWS